MPAEQRAAIRAFIEHWQDRGDEKQDTQSFWLALLRTVYGVSDPARYIEFEKRVQLSHTSFIDAYIPETRVLIEQKGAAIDLRKGQKQSDGSILSPFQQARRYAGYLPYDQRPRWIIVSNFTEFHIHDMNRPNDEPEIVRLADLEKEAHRMNFLIDTGDDNTRRELELSIDAGRIVGALYDALLAQYNDPDDPETLKSLNMLCVRLVFCLYAEDAGIFGRHGMFHDYLKGYAVKDVRRALLDLFATLNTPEDARDPYMDEDLAAFPYVNGGLFADANVIVPRLDEHIVEIILQRASADFDWSAISPTIFGAVFESTLNPDTRRKGGMHYTSIENIHKVIDPLFLDDLRAELAEIQAISVEKRRNAALDAYQDKLAGLTFLDPACGSGNFLTETYISLRRLENDALRSRLGSQISLGAIANPVRVSIGQFYGIEINDFAVTVARTALWIAESQMLRQTEDIIHMNLDFLPLKSYVNITEANALRIDWADVVAKDEVDYIMGNPPFVGTKYLSDGQRNDMDAIWQGKRGKSDYVTCWYIKTASYLNSISQNTQCAFVSTNSICQGEQACSLWKKILVDEHCEITFAVRSFDWESESIDNAAVHVVIVGFAKEAEKEKRIYSGDHVTTAKEINGYLLDAPVVLIEERSKPLCSVPAIVRGSQATDDGQYLFTAEEKEQFLAEEPGASPYFKRFMMGKEFINNIERWCLWMPTILPSELKKLPKLRARVEAVKAFREDSKNAQTRKAAEIPWRFGQYRKPAAHYIAFAKVSSERRRYIPFGFMTDEVIPGDKLFTIPDATLYHFGVLTSNIHMAWMRTVCGRMKSDYSYSTTIVYNNFPWPSPTDAQRARIEETAQGILDARALYPEASLADLYDELTMPPELRKAHVRNDQAVAMAYGLNKNSPEYNSESACVAMLMRMYQQLTSEMR